MITVVGLAQSVVAKFSISKYCRTPWVVDHFYIVMCKIMTCNQYIGEWLTRHLGTFPSPSATTLVLGNVGNKKR